MSLSKVNYIAKQTKITAANLNDIQDSIIDLESNALQKTASGSVYKVDFSNIQVDDVRSLGISKGKNSDVGCYIDPEGTGEAPELIFKGINADQIVKLNNVKLGNALTINLGSTSIVYDGSSAKTVTIEDGTNISY